jgi:hypothetical protein
MGLDYTFTLGAPARTPAKTLLDFLKSVGDYAQTLGFQPKSVFSATFATQEQRDFASRIGLPVSIADEKLKGVVQLNEKRVVNFIPIAGRCHVLPKRAVALVVTDEWQCKTVFAFARYPETIDNVNGKALVRIPFGKRWHFSGLIQNPDPRYRKIVKRFADAGYVKTERDEFYPACLRVGRAGPL